MSYYNGFTMPRRQKCGCVRQWHCGGDWTIRHCKDHEAAQDQKKDAVCTCATPRFNFNGVCLYCGKPARHPKESP